MIYSDYVTYRLCILGHTAKPVTYSDDDIQSMAYYDYYTCITLVRRYRWYTRTYSETYDIQQWWHSDSVYYETQRNLWHTATMWHTDSVYYETQRNLWYTATMRHTDSLYYDIQRNLWHTATMTCRLSHNMTVTLVSHLCAGFAVYNDIQRNLRRTATMTNRLCKLWNTARPVTYSDDDIQSMAYYDCYTCITLVRRYRWYTRTYSETYDIQQRWHTDSDRLSHTMTWHLCTGFAVCHSHGAQRFESHRRSTNSCRRLMDSEKTGVLCVYCSVRAYVF